MTKSVHDNGYHINFIQQVNDLNLFRVLPRQNKHQTKDGDPYVITYHAATSWRAMIRLKNQSTVSEK